jgi:hypothetical protein
MRTKLLAGLLGAAIALPLTAPAVAATTDGNYPVCSATVKDECIQRDAVQRTATRHLTRSQEVRARRIALKRKPLAQAHVQATRLEQRRATTATIKPTKAVVATRATTKATTKTG